MKLSHRQRTFIDIVQWILIGILIVLCGVIFIGNRRLEKHHGKHLENTYIRIYNSHRIADLERENAMLIDSLRNVNARIKSRK